ncbi:hypothetical protein AB0D27_06925 [Streptomyces sp. NPDC048415]
MPCGDDIFVHGGFAVHFFSRALVEALAEGCWKRCIGARRANCRIA